ncbi:hypothetical protein N9L68_08825 [bacterium]|nr:hypothetical protein [bacterium]
MVSNVSITTSMNISISIKEVKAMMMQGNTKNKKQEKNNDKKKQRKHTRKMITHIRFYA